MEDYLRFLPLIIIVAVGGLIFLLTAIFGKKGHTDVKKEGEPIEPILTERFLVGRYLGGFPGYRSSLPFVHCAVTEKFFVFTRGTQGEEIGRIPRDSIKQVVADHKSQITQKLTSVGAFDKRAIDSSPKKESYCLLIDWCSMSGERHNTLFEPTGFDRATTAQNAADTLKNWMTTNTKVSL